MSLFGKMEKEINIKTPATKFYEIYLYSPHHTSTVSPSKIQTCDLHEGAWGEAHSILSTNYTHDGIPEEAKVQIEEMDYENKSITYKTIEGHFLERYKTFKTTLQVYEKDEGTVVRWTLEYEKLDENIPDPHTFLQLLVDITKTPMLIFRNKLRNYLSNYTIAMSKNIQLSGLVIRI